MKYLLLTSLFLSFSVSSQTRMMPVECGTLKDLSSVMVEYQEKPFAIGETTRMNNNGVAVQSAVIMFLNKKTSTWTIAEKIGSDMYCIISSGTNFSIVEQETKL